MKGYKDRNVQPIVIFTHEPFQIEPLIIDGVNVPIMFDPSSTTAATYGLAFQINFRNGTVPWSARASTLVIDRSGILRYVDGHSDRDTIWTPLRVLDDLANQRALITSLKSHGTKSISAIATALAPLGPKTKTVLPEFAKLLNDEHADVRAAAAAALYWIALSADACAPELSKSLTDEDARVRRLAGRALGRIGKPAESHLIGALKHQDPQIRIAAAWDLSGYASPGKQVASALAGALRDKNSWVRVAAARSLQRLPVAPNRKEPALDALAVTLTDANKIVRDAAGDTLKDIGPHAAPAASTIAKALRHKNGGVRILTGYVLQRIGPAAKAAIPALVHSAIYDNGNPRYRGLDALRGIGPEATTALVEKLVRGNDRERARIADALGYIRQDDKRVVPALIRALDDKAISVRIQSAVALGKYGSQARAALPVLNELLVSNNAGVRKAAGDAIGNIDQ